jgi:hypothetical protein
MQAGCHASTRVSLSIHAQICGARQFRGIPAKSVRSPHGKICAVSPGAVTAERFRRIALALEGAWEGSHMGHPDFRVDKRIFASLHTENQFGVVKLTPDQQSAFLEDHPASFVPESGAWGRAGATRVILKTVAEEALGHALTLAWRNTKKLPRKKCR